GTGRLPDEAEAFEAMLAHALASWEVEDPWLKRNMSRKHRAVLDRDDWRCVFPGCASQKNLHVHHIRFRSAGGGDQPENLTTLCAFHHLRGVHGGTVGVSGSAPDGLEFALGLRAGLAPLARYRSGDRVVA
ncbi:MAG: HNH endonuclease, partial [bacterium]|nr:HNH endonuclease [bacterium]